MAQVRNQVESRYPSARNKTCKSNSKLRQFRTPGSIIGPTRAERVLTLSKVFDRIQHVSRLPTILRAVTTTTTIPKRSPSERSQPRRMARKQHLFILVTIVLCLKCIIHVTCNDERAERRSRLHTSGGPASLSAIDIQQAQEVGQQRQVIDLNKLPATAAATESLQKTRQQQLSDKSTVSPRRMDENSGKSKNEKFDGSSGVITAKTTTATAAKTPTTQRLILKSFVANSIRTTLTTSTTVQPRSKELNNSGNGTAIGTATLRSYDGPQTVNDSAIEVNSQAMENHSTFNMGEKLSSANKQLPLHERQQLPSGLDKTAVDSTDRREAVAVSDWQSPLSFDSTNHAVRRPPFSIPSQSSLSNIESDLQRQQQVVSTLHSSIGQQQRQQYPVDKLSTMDQSIEASETISIPRETSSLLVTSGSQEQQQNQFKPNSTAAKRNLNATLEAQAKLRDTVNQLHYNKTLAYERVNVATGEGVLFNGLQLETSDSFQPGADGDGRLSESQTNNIVVDFPANGSDGGLEVTRPAEYNNDRADERNLISNLLPNNYIQSQDHDNNRRDQQQPAGQANYYEQIISVSPTKAPANVVQYLNSAPSTSPQPVGPVAVRGGWSDPLDTAADESVHQQHHRRNPSGARIKLAAAAALTIEHKKLQPEEEQQVVRSNSSGRKSIGPFDDWGRRKSSPLAAASHPRPTATAAGHAASIEDEDSDNEETRHDSAASSPPGNVARSDELIDNNYDDQQKGQQIASAYEDIVTWTPAAGPAAYRAGVGFQPQVRDNSNSAEIPHINSKNNQGPTRSEGSDSKLTATSDYSIKISESVEPITEFRSPSSYNSNTILNRRRNDNFFAPPIGYSQERNAASDNREHRKSLMVHLNNENHHSDSDTNKPHTAPKRSFKTRKSFVRATEKYDASNNTEHNQRSDSFSRSDAKQKKIMGSEGAGSNQLLDYFNSKPPVIKTFRIATPKLNQIVGDDQAAHKTANVTANYSIKEPRSQRELPRQRQQDSYTNNVDGRQLPSSVSSIDSVPHGQGSLNRWTVPMSGGFSPKASKSTDTQQSIDHSTKSKLRTEYGRPTSVDNASSHDQHQAEHRVTNQNWSIATFPYPDPVENPYDFFSMYQPRPLTATQRRQNQSMQSNLWPFNMAEASSGQLQQQVAFARPSWPQHHLEPATLTGMPAGAYSASMKLINQQQPDGPAKRLNQRDIRDLPFPSDRTHENELLTINLKTHPTIGPNQLFWMAAAREAAQQQQQQEQLRSKVPISNSHTPPQHRELPSNSGGSPLPMMRRPFAAMRMATASHGNDPFAMASSHTNGHAYAGSTLKGPQLAAALDAMRSFDEFAHFQPAHSSNQQEFNFAAPTMVNPYFQHLTPLSAIEDNQDSFSSFMAAAAASMPMSEFVSAPMETNQLVPTHLSNNNNDMSQGSSQSNSNNQFLKKGVASAISAALPMANPITVRDPYGWPVAYGSQAAKSLLRVNHVAPAPQFMLPANGLTQPGGTASTDRNPSQPISSDSTLSPFVAHPAGLNHFGQLVGAYSMLQPTQVAWNQPYQLPPSDSTATSKTQESRIRPNVIQLTISTRKPTAAPTIRERLISRLRLFRRNSNSTNSANDSNLNRRHKRGIAESVGRSFGLNNTRLSSILSLRKRTHQDDNFANDLTSVESRIVPRVVAPPIQPQIKFNTKLALVDMNPGSHQTASKTAFIPIIDSNNMIDNLENDLLGQALLFNQRIHPTTGRQYGSHNLIPSESMQIASHLPLVSAGGAPANMFHGSPRSQINQMQSANLNEVQQSFVNTNSMLDDTQLLDQLDKFQRNNYLEPPANEPGIAIAKPSTQVQQTNGPRQRIKQLSKDLIKSSRKPLTRLMKPIAQFSSRLQSNKSNTTMIALGSQQKPTSVAQHLNNVVSPTVMMSHNVASLNNFNRLALPLQDWLSTATASAAGKQYQQTNLWTKGGVSNKQLLPLATHSSQPMSPYSFLTGNLQHLSQPVQMPPLVNHMVGSRQFGHQPQVTIHANRSDTIDQHHSFANPLALADDSLASSVSFVNPYDKLKHSAGLGSNQNVKSNNNNELMFASRPFSSLYDFHQRRLAMAPKQAQLRADISPTEFSMFERAELGKFSRSHEVSGPNLASQRRSAASLRRISDSNQSLRIARQHVPQSMSESNFAPAFVSTHGHQHQMQRQTKLGHGNPSSTIQLQANSMPNFRFISSTDANHQLSRQQQKREPNIRQNNLEPLQYPPKEFGVTGFKTVLTDQVSSNNGSNIHGGYHQKHYTYTDSDIYPSSSDHQVKEFQTTDEMMTNSEQEEATPGKLMLAQSPSPDNVDSLSTNDDTPNSINSMLPMGSSGNEDLQFAHQQQQINAKDIIFEQQASATGSNIGSGTDGNHIIPISQISQEQIHQPQSPQQQQHLFLPPTPAFFSSTALTRPRLPKFSIPSINTITNKFRQHLMQTFRLNPLSTRWPNTMLAGPASFMSYQQPPKNQNQGGQFFTPQPSEVQATSFRLETSRPTESDLANLMKSNAFNTAGGNTMLIQPTVYPNSLLSSGNRFIDYAIQQQQRIQPVQQQQHQQFPINIQHENPPISQNIEQHQFLDLKRPRQEQTFVRQPIQIMVAEQYPAARHVGENLTTIEDGIRQNILSQEIPHEQARTNNTESSGEVVQDNQDISNNPLHNVMTDVSGSLITSDGTYIPEDQIHEQTQRSQGSEAQEGSKLESIDNQNPQRHITAQEVTVKSNDTIETGDSADQFANVSEESSIQNGTLIATNQTELALVMSAEGIDQSNDDTHKQLAQKDSTPQVEPVEAGEADLGTTNDYNQDKQNNGNTLDVQHYEFERVPVPRRKTIMNSSQIVRPKSSNHNAKSTHNTKSSSTRTFQLKATPMDVDYQVIKANSSASSELEPQIVVDPSNGTHGHWLADHHSQNSTQFRKLQMPISSQHSSTTEFVVVPASEDRIEHTMIGPQDQDGNEMINEENQRPQAVAHHLYEINRSSEPAHILMGSNQLASRPQSIQNMTSSEADDYRGSPQNSSDHIGNEQYSILIDQPLVLSATKQQKSSPPTMSPKYINKDEISINWANASSEQPAVFVSLKPEKVVQQYRKRPLKMPKRGQAGVLTSNWTNRNVTAPQIDQRASESSTNERASRVTDDLTTVSLSPATSSTTTTSTTTRRPPMTDIKHRNQDYSMKNHNLRTSTAVPVNAQQISRDMLTRPPKAKVRWQGVTTKKLIEAKNTTSAANSTSSLHKAELASLDSTRDEHAWIIGGMTHQAYALNGNTSQNSIEPTPINQAKNVTISPTHLKNHQQLHSQEVVGSKNSSQPEPRHANHVYGIQSPSPGESKIDSRIPSTPPNHKSSAEISNSTDTPASQRRESRTGPTSFKLSSSTISKVWPPNSDFPQIEEAELASSATETSSITVSNIEATNTTLLTSNLPEFTTAVSDGTKPIDESQVKSNFAGQLRREATDPSGPAITNNDDLLQHLKHDSDSEEYASISQARNDKQYSLQSKQIDTFEPDIRIKLDPVRDDESSSLNLATMRHNLE